MAFFLGLSVLPRQFRCVPVSQIEQYSGSLVQKFAGRQVRFASSKVPVLDASQDFLNKAVVGVVECWLL